MPATIVLEEYCNGLMDRRHKLGVQSAVRLVKETPRRYVAAELTAMLSGISLSVFATQRLRRRFRRRLW